MKTNSPFLIAALAAVLILSFAPTSAAQPAAADCPNYGNQLNVGSHYLCAGQGGCTNYGIIANVGSTYECSGGSCSNDGILVNVGSKYCGVDKSVEVCEAGTCIDIPPSSPSSPSQPNQPSPAASGCTPKVQIGDFGTVSITCDSTHAPCGVAKSPACWGLRYLCGNGLGEVLKTYDGIKNAPESSQCETQPGAPSNSNTSANLPCCPPVEQGCYYTIGNCTGGNCTFNVVGACSLHGSCWLNAVGACDGGACALNVASVCSESCTAKVVGVCINRPIVVELPGPFPNGPSDPGRSEQNVLGKAPVAA